MSSLWLADRANRPPPANASLEALFAAAGATGSTTAKTSLLQGTKMSKIVAKQGQKRRSTYAQSEKGSACGA